jgi:predicted RNase H-like HicB family nuclease
MMMEEMKYQISIYWNFDKKVYVAEVPELDGCIGQGDSYETALSNVLKEMKKWTNKAFASSMLIPQPIGRLPLRDELYCINCKGHTYTNRRWVRSKE